MRIACWMVGVVAVAALAGCSEDAEPTAPESPSEAPTAAASSAAEVDLSAFRQGEIPAEYPRPDLGGMPPEPGDTVPLEDRIAWEALEAVTDFGSVLDPDASASCPSIDLESDTGVVCTVEYFGETYDYEIANLSFTSTGLNDGENEYGYASYSAVLVHGPVVRDQVEAVLRFKRGTEYVICDMDAVVKLEVDVAQSLGATGLTGTLPTRIECRALNAATGAVETLPLEIFEFGSPSSFD